MDNGKRTVSDLSKMSLEEFKLKLLLLGGTPNLVTRNAYRWEFGKKWYLFISMNGKLGASHGMQGPEVAFRTFEKAIEWLTSTNME